MSQVATATCWPDAAVVLANRSGGLQKAVRRFEADNDGSKAVFPGQTVVLRLFARPDVFHV